MRVKELDEFVEKHTLPLEGWVGWKAKEKRAALKAYLHPGHSTGPEVTGFNITDPLHKAAVDAENVVAHGEEEIVRTIHGWLESVDLTYYQIGAVCSLLLAKKFVPSPYESVFDWAEAVFDVKKRTLRYWIQIYETLMSLGVHWDDVKDIRWTVLASVVSRLNEHNWREWLSKVRSLSRKEIRGQQEEVEKRPKRTRPEEPKAPPPHEPVLERPPVRSSTRFAFDLYEDQLEVVRAALIRAREEGETDYDNQALYYICLDYLGSPSHVSHKPTTLVDVFNSIRQSEPDLEVALVEKILRPLSEVFPEASISAEV